MRLDDVGVLKQHYHFWTMDHRLLCHLDFKVLRPEDTDYPFNLHLEDETKPAAVAKPKADEKDAAAWLDGKEPLPREKVARL